MTPEQQRELRETHEKTVALHTGLLGRGGLFERVEAMERKIAAQELFQTRVVAYAVAAAFLVSAAWSVGVTIWKH